MSLSSSYKALRSSRSLSLPPRKLVATREPEVAQGLPQNHKALEELTRKLVAPERSYLAAELVQLILLEFPVTPSSRPSDAGALRLLQELCSRGLLEITPGGSRYFLAGSTPF